MQMTFKEAVEHAMKVTGRATSWRSVATGAGVSEHILKNIKQGKSQKPNYDAAMKVAEFFGVTLEEFYAGNVRPPSDDVEADEAKARLEKAILRLSTAQSMEKLADYAETILLAEQASRQKQ